MHALHSSKHTKTEANHRFVLYDNKNGIRSLFCPIEVLSLQWLPKAYWLNAIDYTKWMEFVESFANVKTQKTNYCDIYGKMMKQNLSLSSSTSLPAVPFCSIDSVLNKNPCWNSIISHKNSYIYRTFGYMQAKHKLYGINSV